MSEKIKINNIKNGAIPLGAIIGIGITLIFLIFLGPLTAPYIKEIGDSLAQWILVAMSILATVISGVAIFLLYQTLEATKDALTVANESNNLIREEQRPWIKIDITFQKITAEDNTILVEILPTLTNIGRNPAFDVTLEVDLFLETLLNHHFEKFWQNALYKKKNDNNRLSETIFPKTFSKMGVYPRKLFITDPQNINLEIICSCQYRSEHTGEIKTTAQSFDILKSINGNHYQRPSFDDINDPDVEIVVMEGFWPAKIT